MFQEDWEVAVGDLSLRISCLIVHEGDCSHGLVTTMHYSHQNLVDDLSQCSATFRVVISNEGDCLHGVVTTTNLCSTVSLVLLGISVMMVTGHHNMLSNERDCQHSQPRYNNKAMRSLVVNNDCRQIEPLNRKIAKMRIFSWFTTPPWSGITFQDMPAVWHWSGPASKKISKWNPSIDFINVE